MDLSKKTTILLSEDLYEQLSRLARQRGASMGELIREACRKQYRFASRAERLEAVRALGALGLPVGEPEELSRESVPRPDELLP